MRLSAESTVDSLRSSQSTVGTGCEAQIDRGPHFDAVQLPGGATALDSNQEKRMNYKNGIALDMFGNSTERTLGSIESSRLAQAYLRLTDAYRLSDGLSPRNFAIDTKAKRIARALAVSVC